MVGEMPNDSERSVRDRRQPLAELGQDSRLDMSDHPQQHVVEQLDLLGTVLVRMVQKEVGHAPQRYNALVARAGVDRLVQLRNEGMADAHGMPLPGDRKRTTTDVRDAVRKGLLFRSSHGISLRLWG